jgi:hypothetical protein
MPLVFAPCGTRLVSGPQTNPANPQGRPSFYFWSPEGAQWQNQVAAPPPLPQAFHTALAVAWAPPEHGSILGAVCLLSTAPASYELLLWQEVEGAWEALAQVPLGAAGGGGGGGSSGAAAPHGCLAFAPCHLGLRLACSAGSGGLVRVFQAADAARLGEWELCEDFSAAPPDCSSSSSSSDGGSAALPAAPPVTSLCWCPSAGDAPLLAVACGGQARVWGLARSASAAAAAAASGSGSSSGGGQWVSILELQSSGSGSAGGAGLAAAAVAWAPCPGRAEHCLATGSASGELVFWRVAASGSPSARAIGGGAGEGRARPASGGGLVGAVQSTHQGQPTLRSLQFNAAGTTLAVHSVDPASGEGSVELFRQELGGGWARTL